MDRQQQPFKDYSEFTTRAFVLLKQIQEDAALGRYFRAAQGALDMSRLMLELARSLRKMQQ